MREFAACTIVAHNYLPLARIAARSFLNHHPESSFYIVIVDRPTETRQIREDGIEIVPVTEIDFGAEGYCNMATIYDVTEFATSVKPFALKHLLQFHDCVLYLDPDIKVFNRLDDLVEKTFEKGWSLTPHCLLPIPRTGAGPTEREIMAAGVYNLGYVGVTRERVDFLEWWAERLRRDAIIDVERQLFTDQRWIDLAVGIFDPHIERSEPYNVAYWNLDQRTVSKDNGQWLINEQPLRFFHFSGYDPKQPHWMSKYQVSSPRVLFSDRPELVELFEQYKDDLLGMRGVDEEVLPYGWTEAFPGFKLSRGLRRMFRDELLKADENGTQPPPSPFIPGSLGLFISWVKDVPKDSQTGLPRYAEAIYRDRHDLRYHFPEVNYGDLNRFNLWVQRDGRAERVELELFDYLNRPQLTREVVKDSGRSTDGIDVIGYLQAELGVGEAGRLLVKALESNSVTVSTVNIADTKSRQGHQFVVSNEARHRKVVVAVNADQIERVRQNLGRDFFIGRHVIGQWFWELSEPPDSYKHVFHLVDELWAPTIFIKESLEKLAPPNLNIVHMPLPLVTPEFDPTLTKESFGLDNRFVFLFSFDFLSVLKRKNTLGLVESFCSAFKVNEGPVLVLKSINGNLRLNELERLKWAIKDRPDIVLIDEYFDVSKTAALMAVSDCYVSLHRSEGLGLTMAEAMLLGKPVIATGYSGNMDFMNEANSILISWSPVEVGPDAEGYPEDAIWAEPDLEEAAKAMQKVFSDPEFASRLGDEARRDLSIRFSPTTAGQKMKAHLFSA